MKNFLHIAPPENAESFSKRLFESSLLRSLPFYLTLPAFGLLASENVVGILAFMAIKMAAVEYLRGQQKVLRDGFNRFANENLSSRERVDVEPLLKTLNHRPASSLSISLNDLNPLKQPLAFTFGLAAGLSMHSPVVGIAIAAETLAIQEMFHMGKIKVHSMWEYNKSIFTR